MKRISLQTSDKTFYTDFNNQKFDGLKISVFTKDSVEKEITDALTYIVTFGAGIATNVFSNWLYDKIKKNPDNKIVINGNQINAETINVTNIIQIISNDEKK
jgi:type 1 glutamine amidotransferase